jgi:hypothetical protein
MLMLRSREGCCDGVGVTGWSRRCYPGRHSVFLPCSVPCVDPEQPPRFGPVARAYLRAGQTAMLAFERLRGGPPEVATCADVRRSNRKLKEVARAVYNELVGMEESHRRIYGSAEGLTPVALRFPRGWREVEPLVLDGCARSKPDDQPYSLTLRPLATELGLSG